MNIDELAQKLEKMFNSGENKNAMTQLFMIIYYDEITRLHIPEHTRSLSGSL